MNKIAKGDKYLDYLNETLERVTKPWDVLLGRFSGQNCRYELSKVSTSDR